MSPPQAAQKNILSRPASYAPNFTESIYGFVVREVSQVFQVQMRVYHGLGEIDDRSAFLTTEPELAQDSWGQLGNVLWTGESMNRLLAVTERDATGCGQAIEEVDAQR